MFLFFGDTEVVVVLMRSGSLDILVGLRSGRARGGGCVRGDVFVIDGESKCSFCLFEIQNLIFMTLPKRLSEKKQEN
jgi:hypothetical protein